MRRNEFMELVKSIKETTEPQAIESGGGMNAILMGMYKAETGEQVFRTISGWRELGYKVKKGSSSYPVWSRPIDVIKNEKNKTESSGDTDNKYFGIAHLFHTGQVEKSTYTKKKVAVK